MVATSKGEEEKARKDIEEAAAMVHQCEGGDFIGTQPVAPVWYDWVVAKLLIDEARAMVEGPPAE
jgi:hypothetical protein